MNLSLLVNLSFIASGVSLLINALRWFIRHAVGPTDRELDQRLRVLEEDKRKRDCGE